jgi:hypothetical protein
MKLIGLLIILLGGILIWFTSLPQVIAWILVIVGAIILIFGFILKTEAS